MGSSFIRLIDRRHRPARRRKTRVARPDRPLAVETLEARTLLTGTWTPLAQLAPSTITTLMLLTDGTVLAQGPASTPTWYKLTPDASGSYVNGTWSQLASMSMPRLYFASNVLPDGRVFLVGGEFTGSNFDHTNTNTGEIYDPVANTWTPIQDFPEHSFGDDPSALLPDGRVLGGYIIGAQTYIYDPASDTWTFAANKLRSDRSDEETWVTLPDGSILSYDIFHDGHAQRYLPDQNQWVDAGTVPVTLSGSSQELGPAHLLPDGRVFFIGATSHTALYDPSTDTWTAGPDIPGGLGADDAPGAMLPNGQVLFSADPPGSGLPTLFEFDPVTNTMTPVVNAPDLGGRSFAGRLLILPSGEVLFTHGTRQLQIYTPVGTADPSWRPTIASVADNGDGTFTVTGTQLNGISEGAAYGDDAEMSSNYPIVRLVDADGNVFYARTFGWGVGVATGDTPVSTQFTLPAGIPAGTYSLSVVANGIASDPVPYTFGATHFSVVASTDLVTAGAPFTVTVTALDTNDNPVSNYQGTVRFRSTDPQASLPARYTFTAADNGVHTFTVTLATAGRRAITVTDVANHSLRGRAKVTVVAAPASQLVVSTSAADPQPAGAAFDVTVVGLDPYGNIDTNYQGTVTWTTTDGNPGVALAADYTFQASDQGQVTFPGGVTLLTPGDQTLTATDTLSGITGAASFTVTSGTAPGAGSFGAKPAVSQPQQPPQPATVATGTSSRSTVSADPEGYPVRTEPVAAAANRAVLIDHVWSDPADPVLTGRWLDGLV
jgi:hypothetical protein